MFVVAVTSRYSPRTLEGRVGVIALNIDIKWWRKFRFTLKFRKNDLLIKMYQAFMFKSPQEARDLHLSVSASC